MRVVTLCVFIALLAGCASVRNAPSKPHGSAWPVNGPAQQEAPNV